MAGYRLDAEKLGLDPDPQRPPVRKDSTEFTTTKSRVMLFCLGVIALLARLVVLKSTQARPERPAPASALLELRVEGIAGQLVLKWNKESDAVRNAQQATLSITDGDHTEDVALDLATLRGGSAVYAPLTADVTFRLTVVSRQGESRSATVRILGDPRR
jgi:hypothetical protein